MGGKSETRKYTDDLTVALRLRGADGTRTGEVVAEVESHLAGSGEDPESAFGPARQYARTMTPSFRPRPSRRQLVIGVCGALAGWLLAGGVVETVRRDDGMIVGPGWLDLIVGAVLFVVVGALLPRDPIVDPRTGRADGPRRTTFVLVFLGCAVKVALVVLGVAAVVG